MRRRILTGPWTDFQVRAEFFALNALGPSVIASATNGGVGDDIGPDTTDHLVLTEDEMSHAAIAAVLERDDLSTAERLVAFSLASFANSDHLAWPGTPVAAARAGLPKSRYVEARDALARRGLIVIDDPSRGRGRSSTITLEFARSGPWWDGAVNAKLFEGVLGHSRSRGAARLLLAALAALADDEGTVENLSTDEVRDAAGLSDTTYRRARAALLLSGELDLLADGGGRSRMNRWRIAAVGRLGLEPRPAAAHRAVAGRPAPLVARAPGSPAYRKSAPRPAMRGKRAAEPGRRGCSCTAAIRPTFYTSMARSWAARTPAATRVARSCSAVGIERCRCVMPSAVLFSRTSLVGDRRGRRALR